MITRSWSRFRALAERPAHAAMGLTRRVTGSTLDGAVRTTRSAGARARELEQQARAAAAAAAQREERAREREERSRQRLDLLVAAGQVLGGSLDFDETLRGLVRVAIPLLGDYGLADVAGDRTVHRFVATSLPDREHVVAALEARPVDLDGMNPIAEVMRSGRSMVVEVDAATRRRIAVDDVHADAIAQTGITRALVIPLSIRGHAIGALTFGRLDAGRPFHPDDIAAGEVLAQRAAKAIDNSRLHREAEQMAAHERARANELRSVLAAIGEGIILLDGAGAVRTSNAAAERMLGGPVANDTELARRLLADEDDAPRAGIASGPTEFQTDSPTRRWLEVTNYPMADGRVTDGPTVPGQPLGSVMVLRDVTAFRQGQGLREAFLGLLSHELRTPITSIYAGAMVLGSRGERLPASTRTEILSDVVAESDRLFRLIEDLMVLARFDEGMELVGEPSLLQRLVPQVVEAEQKRWPQARFVVATGSGLPAVAGDDTSIQQIVRNLLSNAAKYAPADQTVDIEVEADDAGVAVRVLDRGPGLGGAEMHDLFTPFYRAPSTAAVAAGAGIGLYVCQRLIEAMGGRIWARARAGGGSEFGFWLPPYVTDAPDGRSSERDGLAAAGSVSTDDASARRAASPPA